MDHASSIHTQLEILRWLFRLELSGAGPQIALKTFSRALQLLGYDSQYLPPRLIPDKEETILSLLTAPLPPQTEGGWTAMALADLMGIAGPTIYSYVEPAERSRIFDFVIPILLQDHNATKHPTTAYTFYLYAILLGGEDLSNLRLVKSWIKVADTYRLESGPIEAAVETLRATVAYITTTGLETIDFTRAHQLCLATSNYDIMSYVLGLALATKTFSGTSIGDMFRNGKANLGSLSGSLQPTARLMTVPFLQVRYRSCFGSTAE